MSFLQRVSRRFRYLLLVTGLATSAATAVATIPGASATNQDYSCSSCTYVPGPDNYVRNNEAINYTRDGVAATLWLSNGEFVQEAYSSGYKALVCHKSGEFYGHGDAAERSGESAHLAGRQDNYSGCE
jgi:hypothetical protein